MTSNLFRDMDPAYIAGEALAAAWRRIGNTSKGLSPAQERRISPLRVDLVAAPADTLHGACAKAKLLYGGYGARVTPAMARELAGDILLVLQRHLERA